MFSTHLELPSPRARLADGLSFPESPRWHGGRLWFSDIHAGAVLSVGLDGAVREELRLERSPSGLGWAPDGDLLVVSMEDRRLLGHDGRRTYEVADLSGVLRARANDMLVASDGSAFIGGWGYDLEAGEPFAPGAVARVDPSGDVQTLADGLAFPNGMAWVPGGLLVAETMGARLSLIDTASFTGPAATSAWAELPGTSPDGMAVDQDGGVWVADATGHRAVRVVAGGEVTDVVTTDGLHVFACELGGDDEELLFLCCAPSFRSQVTRKARAGVIEVVKL